MAVTGFVEYVSPQQIRGWAADREQPDLHVDIAVSIDGAEIASTKAELYRNDLLEAGVGKGDHGFVINFDPILSVPDLDALDVCAAGPMGQAFMLRKLASGAAPPAPPPAPRAKVVNAGGEVSDATQYPVFVLGAARSGTSAVAQALLKTSYYAGHEEGHALALMAQQMTTIHRYYAANGEETLTSRDTTLAQIPKEYFLHNVANTFKNLIPSLWENTHWIDKTPNGEMIAASPLFLRLWPNAKFVFMKRRGLENIVSRLRKFPQVSFEANCSDWAAVMRIWGVTRHQLSGRAIEIEQLDLATQPEETASRLAHFLNLPASIASRLSQTLLVERPERTSQNFAMPLSLRTMAWTDAQKDVFKTICGPQMLAYGYTTDEQYYAIAHIPDDIILRSALHAAR